MKKPYLLTLFLLSVVFSFAQADFASYNTKANFNTNSIESEQVDSIKNAMSAEGFSLMKEAPINMESEYEMPVIVPLNEGSLYQFVFIGEKTSRLYEVRMFDWNERMVIFKQNRWGDVDGNIISYIYQPKVSEFHMIKPVQVNKKKKKNLYGYIMMFKKTQQ